MPVSQWCLWALILMLQNVAFTFNSRARNSASINRHIFSSLASNGVFFICNFYLFNEMVALLQGKAGLLKQFGAMVFYTLFTATGAIIAHYISIHTEKGKAASGASKRYAQIPIAEWEVAKKQLRIDQILRAV